jgi:hypothetical protein
MLLSVGRPVERDRPQIPTLYSAGSIPVTRSKDTAQAGEVLSALGFRPHGRLNLAALAWSPAWTSISAGLIRFPSAVPEP